MPKSKLARVSIAELKAELQKRRRPLPRLRREHARTLKKLQSLDESIAALEDLATAVKVCRKKTTKRKKVAKKAVRKVSKKRRAAKKAIGKRKAGRKRRGGKRISLTASLANALKAKSPLSVAEATQAVLKRGYRSKSKIFRTIVCQTLSKDKQFKSVKRGVYALK
ncbi:MAG: hypothetical protein QF577_00960 [Phycisphaerae bacterium]|jgi:hypothetical protein|nr:hypothetical protein [Phycisphaerae bacterium]